MASETIAEIADIVAEMRRGTKLPGYWRSHDVNKILQYHADRIEAAAERLREDVIVETVKAAAISAVAVYEPHIHDDNPSNAAALREALLLCYRVIHCAMVAGVINRDDANKAMDAYHAALAKPPRNCDRFGGDIDKLREACARERGLNPEEDFPDVFPDWLLAPSTEKEGGEK